MPADAGNYSALSTAGEFLFWLRSDTNFKAKKQVQRMVGTLLGLPELPTPDHAADALAVAICHGGGTGRREALAMAEGIAR